MTLSENEDCTRLTNNSASENILKNLQKQKAEGMFCDVKLCLGGSVTWGHACVVAPLSSYIMQRFKCSSGADHWCPKLPLVIDMDVLITTNLDKCVSCLSALVDFMYSQHLVILDGHVEHFSKMVHCLKIIDLIPLFKKHLNQKKLMHMTKEVDAEQLQFGDKLVDKLENGVQENNLSLTSSENDLVDLVQTDTFQIVNSYEEFKEVTNQRNTELNSTLGNSCGLEGSKKIESFSENTNFSSGSYKSHSICDIPEGITQEHNYGCREETNVQSKCSFLCCSNEIFPSTTSKNHRRKIKCENCSFTAVSIKKFLKHLENINHLGKLCPICTLKFSSKEVLIQHLKDHNNSKPYLCQFCNKRSRFFDFYKLHLKVHCKNKKIICKICKKSFNRKESLQVHLKSHKQHFLCSSCNYITSDAETFKSHLLIHEEKGLVASDQQKLYKTDKCLLETDLTKHKTTKKFLCNICGEGFTKKSNLKRHAELKHKNVPNYNCPKCSYVTRRTDLLRNHMKKHHDCLPEEIATLIPKIKKTKSKKHQLNNTEDKSKIVGVLIPVQLVSTNDSSTLNAYAVKPCVSGKPEVEEGDFRDKIELGINKNNSPFSINIGSPPVLNEQPPPLENSCRTLSNELEPPIPLQCLDCCSPEKENSDLLHSDNDAYFKSGFREKDQNIDINITNAQLHLNASFDANTELNRPVLDLSQGMNSYQVSLKDRNTKLNSDQNEDNILASSGEFWLNETTGEFLISNNVLNLQVLDKSGELNNVSSNSENPHEDIADPVHTLILKDSSKSVSIYDLRNDVEEFQSNPQTPLTNVVEVDDPDNLFPWSCIDSSFCSTWVLNETTGELNMVSFNVQAMKHSDELKLDENSGATPTNDDDETALFLNEGTGDLSVIYFNPSKEECDISKQMCGDQGVQDPPDNVSEHSNDEDDFLSEEFFKATASFMAHKENETFLNELTGEFDTNIADFNNYHLELLENEVSTSESYLNEETGEILWNALNRNDVRDLFANTDAFKYDLDDSLNCDDLEPFVDEMNDFSSQFCLETAQDWQPVDETAEILLNERTGELVKKS